MENQPHYPTVIPYLIVNNASGCIDFLKEIFGAEERHRTMRDEKLVAHAEVSIGNSVIMLADATAEFPAMPAGIFMSVEDTDGKYAKALKLGATTVMEPADMPYGRSCGVKDQYGNTWWITTM